MAANRTTFEKLQRDRAKKLKADQKRAKRLSAPGDAPGGFDEGPVQMPEGNELSPDQLLSLVEQITKQLEAGIIDLDEFEERKADLVARMGSI